MLQNNKTRLISLLALFCVSIAVAACSGGGSGSGNGITPIGPTSTPQKQSISGTITDLDTGTPLAGAAVAIGTSFAGGTLSGIAAQTNTATDGSYTIAYTGSAPPFIQIAANGYVTLHKLLTLTPVVAPSPVPTLPPGAVTLPAYHLTKPTAHELAALTQLNADRAKYGTGNGAAPLSFDEDIVEVARWRANDMATLGYFSHTEPGTNLGSAAIKYCGLNNTPGVGGFCGEAGFGFTENISSCTCGDLTAAEASFLAEG
ncbi:MAG TPA: hypothetical protein VIG51_12790, partial [Candidatus Baltobacteraceae bacterium]